jgi:hypothetical protein
MGLAFWCLAIYGTYNDERLFWVFVAVAFVGVAIFGSGISVWLNWESVCNHLYCVN